MKISSKKELKFFLASDLMMNRGFFRYSAKQKIMRLFLRDHIMDFLKALRKTEYYINTGKKRTLGYLFNKYRLSSLGVKLGFSISPGVFGYGLVIPHCGTIVVGDGNQVGNFAVLHTAVCITQGQKVIGDGLYLSTGGKILGDVSLGDGVTVAANAVVNKSFEKGYCLLTGVPATEKRAQEIWYVNDGEKHQNRAEKIKELALKMNLERF